jgi:hypothetical integral membrane protein (TIGR02206 family)
MAVWKGEFSLANDLPFHLCSISQIVLFAYFCYPHQLLYDVLFYWILSGSILAILFPDLQIDFPSYRYFSMFVSHGVSFITILYLFRVRSLTPRSRGYYRSILALLVYAFLIVYPINQFTGGNYLFLAHPPAVSLGAIHLLPPWPWYILLLCIFFFLVFLVFHFSVYLVSFHNNSSAKTEIPK